MQQVVQEVWSDPQSGEVGLLPIFVGKAGHYPGCFQNTLA